MITTWVPLAAVAVICLTTVVLVVLVLRKKGPQGRVVIRSPFATIELDSGERALRNPPRRRKK